MKRFIATLAFMLASLATLVAPVAANASTSASHALPADVSNDHINSYYTGLNIGGNGSGEIVDGGTYSSFTAHLAGQVTGSWPFNVNGPGSTYSGNNVWFFTETGSPSTCINVSGNYLITSTSCGGNHDGSLFVSTRAPNGLSGHEGLVNVYNTDTHSGNGQYMYDGTVHGRVFTYNYSQFGSDESAETFSF